MNGKMRDEFGDAWLELDADPEVKVIVHTGEGRAFQTGVDLAGLSSDGLGMERYRASVEQWDLHFTAWHQQVWKPVITAVNGVCAGGGFHWVADADIVIASSNATFVDPHVSVGQASTIEMIALLRKMPVEAAGGGARRQRTSAQRAYELGMVSEVVDPPERLREAAQELAEKIARNSPSAMAATAALWGRARSHRRVQGGRGRARLAVGSPRPGGGPARVQREARPGVDRVMSLADLLFAPDDLARDDERELLVHAHGVDHTWRQVRERANDLALALAGAGVTEGLPVGVMLPNGADVVAALFGVWRRCRLTYPSTAPAATDLEHVLTSVQPAVIITTAGSEHRFGERPLLLVGAAVQLRAGPVAEAALRIRRRPRAVHLRHHRVDRSRCCSGIPASWSSSTTC
jgi:enoyl-CoA hydratase/carnithine racemase